MRRVERPVERFGRQYDVLALVETGGRRDVGGIAVVVAQWPPGGEDRERSWGGMMSTFGRCDAMR